MKLKQIKDSKKVVETNFAGKQISFESGWIAKQANGAIIAKEGETTVMATVCCADARPDIDFFPLVVEYQEKMYAAGKIPGGYLKREGRLGETEILTCRLIDRPIRPLFPEGYKNEVQIICTVLSSDGIHSPQILAINAASAALAVSDIPFQGPIGAVKVGRVDGKLIANPTYQELDQSDLELVVVGTDDAVVMVEGGSDLVPESEILDALFFGHDELKKLIALQSELKDSIGKEKSEFTPPVVNEDLRKLVTDACSSGFEEGLKIRNKHDRKQKLSEVKEAARDAIVEGFNAQEGSDQYKALIKEIKEEQNLLSKKVAREITLSGTRIDGRSLDEVRDVITEIGYLPNAHGSAVFTRGETQALVVATLGTGDDAQRIDSIKGDEESKLMLHYNFPPFCTGEVKMLRGSSRREIGHGSLAKRAITPIIPNSDSNPYVIRLVSEVLESNGSSSMATVCGSSLALMDAGIKVSHAVSGVAMGMVKDGDRIAVLTDILGDEDHFGDMDFKVCGTEDKVTALQMDIKCKGLSREVLEQALEQARKGREHILSVMKETIAGAGELNKNAPRLETVQVKKDKVRDIIGPGGKTIRSIVETTGAKVDINDAGVVTIASKDTASLEKAKQIILGLIEEAEIGKTYDGVVKKIVDFGAFVEIIPGIEGLVHISQFSEERIKEVTEVTQEGAELKVKVIDIDKQGRVKLSHKEVLKEANA